MFKTYLKVALRNFSRNRLTTFINIFGLGLSMSVGLMIMIRIQDAFSYDKFHPAPSRTFRVTSEYKLKSNSPWKMASTPMPLAEAIRANRDAVEAVVNVYPALHGKMTAAEKEIYVDGAFTNPSFFSVFGFKLLAGNAATALQNPNSIVIGNNMATNFFGGEDAIGKIIKTEDGTSYIVTGVMATPPGKSHLYFDAYASISTVPALEKSNKLNVKSTDWFAFNSVYTYVLLNKGIPASAAGASLNAIAAELNKSNPNGTTAFHLQPLSSITPGTSELENNLGGGTSWDKIFIEAGMALLILLAACFNYTNLTIARALTRAKEVGVRKIVGAKRWQLFLQYILESVILSVLALGFAWLILHLIVRYAPFNDGYEFIPSSFHYNAPYVVWSFLYAVFTGIVAGSSPAWILSAFKPLRVLKNMSTSKWMGKIGLQKSLIVFQYSLSLVILIFLMVFYRQFSYMGNADPGFNKQHVMELSLNGVDEKIVMQKIAAVSGVKSVAATTAKFTSKFSGMSLPVWTTEQKDAVNLHYYFADEHLIPLLDIPLIAGKNFLPANSDAKEQYIIVNEKAVQAFGFASPAAALGQKLHINDTTQVEITGILRDFIYEGAGRPVYPLAFRQNSDAATFLYIQTDGGDKKAMEQKVETAMENFQLKTKPDIFWLDDDIKRSNSQTATISLLGFLGFIALSIASLGLLGLVIYTVQVKQKEISIRKVIGAGEKNIVRILSKGYIKLLLIAGLIAMPIGWLLAAMFLQNFVIRVSFGVMDVFGCFVFLLGIGLFTIVSQTYRAAVANPVVGLRAE